MFIASSYLVEALRWERHVRLSKKHIAPIGATNDTGQKAINILLLRSKDK